MSTREEEGSLSSHLQQQTTITLDDESVSSDRPSPKETRSTENNMIIDITDVPSAFEKLTTSTSSSSSSSQTKNAEEKTPASTPHNNTDSTKINDSATNKKDTTTEEANTINLVDLDEKNNVTAASNGNTTATTTLSDSFSDLLDNERKRGSRQLTKVREMDKELAAWINGFHADNKLDELTREMITERAREIARQKKILDFSGTANWYTRFLGRNFSDSAVSKQLKMLSFTNPGKFMEDFDPERSAREMRKMNRRIYRENVKKNQMYDETGRLLDNSKDVCDCLDEDCPGCHFPCPKCGSEKCGTECRCNRKWVYEIVEIEGTSFVIRNPSII